MTKAELSSCPFLLDEVIVKIGTPVQEILLEIDKNNYDLVILSAHGQGVLADTLMGSVSGRVLRRSKASVLVVRLPEKE
jgi:nucleotide-binding universal stress UspA family protein